MPKWDRRKFLAYAVQISVLYFVFSLLRIPPKLEHGQSEKKKYLIPFISGQGLNNQLWEYRSAAILARSTGRVLCLVPFHRFYLQETGREFIPFQELFDAESIKRFVQISTVDNCSDQCNREIQQHLQLITISKTPFDRKNPFPVAEWRPGSLKLFLKSTGFKSLSVSKMININISEYDKVNSNILEYMNEVLSRYQNSQCVSILGTIPHLSREFWYLESTSFIYSKILEFTLSYSEIFIFIIFETERDLKPVDFKNSLSEPGLHSATGKGFFRSNGVLEIVINWRCC
jgi:hypothetical protein